MTDSEPQDLAGRHRLQRRLSRFLSGDGLEIGPGHSPFPLPFAGARVRYVDRWGPAVNGALFPELAGAAFPEPDVTADLNRDRLRAVPDESVDFVIASHVLEHVAEPIGLIDEIYRVLRSNGTALLLLPDRRRTFDAGRPATTLEHLVVEHERGVDAVDDAHLLDFLSHTGELPPDLDALQRQELLARHRERSIHVHCWAEDEFLPVVEYCIRALGHHWRLLDVVNNADVAGSIEFGLVLQRAPGPADHETAARRLRELYREFGPQSADAGRCVRLESELAERTLERDALLAVAHQQRQRLDALRHSPLGPLLSTAWKVRGRLRGGD